MAPNRRKSKAPSAAAARHKWKIGDLVLAKVKGFPAWPAKVSEPAKWGHKPDSKKVFVFFFGTNQIGFCSHADVEAFTEEKKQALQGKRYGKSADFVRAVKEITESYDKSKTQAQDDNLKHGVESGVTCENSARNLNPGTNETPSDRGLSMPQQNGSSSTKDVSEAILPFEDATSVKDENQILEMSLESSHVSRKKHGITTSIDNVKLRRTLSARRSRTSRIDEYRPLENELPSNNSVAGREDMLSSALCNATSKHSFSQISHHVLNSSHEDDNSGIGSRESNSLDMSEDSSFDYMPDHIRTTGNSNENGLKQLGLDIKAVFVEKKRKPSRKRTFSDNQEMTSSGVKVGDSMCGVHNYRLNSPNACEKSNESPSNIDGDEYLPLVKRARVRMGKLSDLEGHADVSVHDMEEKSTNACSVALANGLSMNSPNKGPLHDEDSTVITKLADSAVPQDDGTVSANVVTDVPFDRVIGKFSPPPSECFHQASEGMPLFAPEESQHSADEQIPKPYLALDSGMSSSTEAAATMTKSNVVEDALPNNVNAACNNEMEVDISSSTAIVILPCRKESKTLLIKTIETMQCGRNSQTLEEASFCAAEHDASDVNCMRLDIEERMDIPANSHLFGDQSPHSSFKQSYDSIQGIADARDHKVSSTDSSEISKYVVRKDDNDALKIKHDSNPDIHGEDEVFHSENLKPQFSQMMPVHQMSRIDEEIKFNSSLTPGISNEPADSKLDPLHLVSDSDECSGEKVVLRIQTSPSSLSASSVNPTNFSSIGSNPQHRGIVYPSDKLLVQREECTSDAGIGRCGTSGTSEKVTNYVEAKTSLTSFGNALGTLTRTKDSICRATRMAIECAKGGLTDKVVEMISRTLENESNLNRKVDLFFLVDSMMQSSRGLKGEIGGLYPSAIQVALPRLLSAAAPSGDAANENRRQCMKVLKLWLERRILPDSVIRHHMRNLDSFPSSSYPSGPFAPRSSRTERAIHDPVREMDGMLVDEYGSNSSFQLSGFCMPRIRKDDFDASDSDSENFEAVTPEHYSETPEEPGQTKGGRHGHILEDVDGELEMEDVAPSEAEMKLSNDIKEISIQMSNSEANVLPFRGPPLPSDVPPASPPLPTSPPPPHVPPPPTVPQNHSSRGPPIQPPSSAVSMSAPHPVCPSHGHPLQSHPSVHSLPPSAAGCLPPVYLPVAAQPSTDRLANGLPPVSPRAQQRQMNVQDPSTNCSFDGFSRSRLAPHPNNGHSNDFCHSDGPTYDSRGFNARPPPLGPPNNFSSVHGDHRGHHSWRGGPPRSFSSNYHRGPSRDDRNHYNEHNWRKPGFQERYDDRRYHGPPFPGDKGGGPYQQHPYMGPPNDQDRGGQGWGYPPRELHHRNSMHVRPSSEDPRYWRQ